MQIIVFTMFDDLPTPKVDKEFPRNLENLSIDELNSYIEDLKSEITRVEGDIKTKQASQEAASNFFKS